MPYVIKELRRAVMKEINYELLLLRRAVIKRSYLGKLYFKKNKQTNI